MTIPSRLPALCFQGLKCNECKVVHENGESFVKLEGRPVAQEQLFNKVAQAPPAASAPAWALSRTGSSYRQEPAPPFWKTRWDVHGCAVNTQLANTALQWSTLSSNSATFELLPTVTQPLMLLETHTKKTREPH